MPDNETDYGKSIEALKKQVEKELDDLYEISSVLNSIRAIFNFKRTGKVYPEENSYAK